MNILFLLKSFEIGGVEVVTSILANKFVSEGHQVILWAFYEKNPSLENRLDKRIELVYNKGFSFCKENVESLRSILIRKNIQVVINQWGLPYIPEKKYSSCYQPMGTAVYPGKGFRQGEKRACYQNNYCLSQFAGQQR